MTRRERVRAIKRRIARADVMRRSLFTTRSSDMPVVEISNDKEYQKEKK